MRVHGRTRKFLRYSPRVGLIPTLVGVSVAIFPVAAAEDAGEDRVGERLYAEQCVSCHGKAGEGVKDKFPHPLTGEDSERLLARYIDRWMPEGNPKDCVGEDAEIVARYIYNAFYSPEAYARNHPVRAALSRITFRQFQNTAADLVGHFRPEPKKGQKEGLQGKYFKTHAPKGRFQLQRVDPGIDFDFSEDAALGKIMDATGFSARWTGSLHAPETGRYRFVVKTDNAARLWVNDQDPPLIDAWVKSGSDTNFTGVLHLIGGRSYPLALEFSSKVQGVQNKFKSEKRSVDGFLELHWGLPGRPTEPIPRHRFSSARTPEVFVLRTILPPDDRSDGYERGTTVSKAWDDAATEAAIEIADHVVENLPGLAKAKKGKKGYPAKVRRFCREFVAHAFRAPLSASREEFYVHRQFEKAPDLESGVKRVVLLALKSPRFLYTDPIDPPSEDYAIASALSFALWDSLPDKRLLKKAAEGQLHTRAQVARQAERMMDDDRGRSKIREFLHHWLKIEETPDLSKRADLFPDFDERIASDMRTSLDLFLERIVADEDAGFRELMLSRELYLNGRLGRFLGFNLPTNARFGRRPSREVERAGVLTHPYVMARFAHDDATSPIHRGVFLARKILGRGLRPPPEAVTPAPPDLQPDLMTRERVALQTEAKACQSCHSLINPLGFTLERFDAVGRARDTEIGRPVDTSGGYLLPDGSAAEFTGARDLAEFLVDHHETHRAFAVQLHHYLVKQPINAYGADRSEELTGIFADNELNLRRVIVEIATNAALAKRSGSSEPVPSPAPAEPRKTNVQPLAKTLLDLFNRCAR